ncbi:putative reverse transcriptase zinc-binding domain-containing protein [Helianthus annuus]|nr:putative reverse transcriptase zinc-binding domain-containing protein [Helianthus annuus]
MWEECSNRLRDVKLSKKSDQWLWKQNDQREEFKVGKLRAQLDEISVIPETKVLRWLNWIPKKINCFLWRVVLDRIPTKDALAIRNIHIPSKTCVLCNVQNESVDHLLISCQYAQLLWSAISSWIKTPFPRYLLSVVGLLEHVEAYNSSQEKKKAVYLIIAATCWTIWRIRNEAIFRSKTSQISKAVGDIKAVSFLWVKARTGKKNLGWIEWSEFKV